MPRTDWNRLVIISEMLQPYRLPVFNALVDQHQIELAVILLSWREKNREWGIPAEDCRFQTVCLPGPEFYIRSLDWGLHFNRGLAETLNQLMPEVIVGTGYVSPALLRAQHYARSHRVGYVLWSGSTAATSRIGFGPLRWSKQWFLRRCQASLSYGSAATQQLVRLGGSPDTIVTGCNTVDVEAIAQRVNRVRNNPQFSEWRQSLPERLILFVGQMIPRKGVAELVETFEKLQLPDTGLVLVGGGPFQPEYRNIFKHVPNLTWTGHLDEDHLAWYLAAAEVLVMPSRREVWGLVVNEAMAAGLPVIASADSGAAVDLVHPGVTGERFATNNHDELAVCLQDWWDAPTRWREMGLKAQTLILQATPQLYAEHLMQAASLAHNKIRNRA